MASNGLKQEKQTIEKFKEKILKSSEAVAHSFYTDYLLWEFLKILQKNVSAPKTYGVTKYRLHHAFLHCSFLDGHGKYKGKIIM